MQATVAQSAAVAPGAHDQADLKREITAVSVGASRRGEVRVLRRDGISPRSLPIGIRPFRGLPMVWCGSAHVVRQRRTPGHLPITAVAGDALVRPNEER